MNKQFVFRFVPVLIGLAFLTVIGPASAEDPEDYFTYLPISRASIQPFRNPDFEQGLVAWSEYSTHGWPVIMTGFIEPHSGAWAAWLGGDYNDYSYVAQEVTITPYQPYLVFYHWIASAEQECDKDVAFISLDSYSIEEFPLCAATNTYGWVPHIYWIDIRGLNTLTILIQVHTNGTLNSNMFVDDVTMMEYKPSADTLLSLETGLPGVVLPAPLNALDGLLEGKSDRLVPVEAGAR
jgi:hypothetical protein